MSVARGMGDTHTDARLAEWRLLSEGGLFQLC